MAPRVESLTKTVGEPRLLTAATRAAFRSRRAVKELPPQWVRGQPEPIVVLSLADSGKATDPA